MDLELEFDWTIEINCHPVPKKAPHFNSQGRAYTPQVARIFHNDLKTIIAAQCPQEPFAGPLSVRVVIFLERPKSISKTQRRYPVTRNTGDCDNHTKMIMDAAQDAGLLKDDAQIVDLYAFKRYADDYPPGIILSVKEIL